MQFLTVGCCPQAFEGTGGAIHVQEFQDVLELTDVRLISNTAATSGGALWASSSLHGQVNVSGAVFAGNKVRVLSSAIVLVQMIGW
jgi:predicted outer membrane repeat protein